MITWRGLSVASRYHVSLGPFARRTGHPNATDHELLYENMLTSITLRGHELNQPKMVVNRYRVRARRTSRDVYKRPSCPSLSVLPSPSSQPPAPHPLQTLSNCPICQSSQQCTPNSVPSPLSWASSTPNRPAPPPRRLSRSSTGRAAAMAAVAPMSLAPWSSTATGDGRKSRSLRTPDSRLTYH